jgi:hypothetical protein
MMMAVAVKSSNSPPPDSQAENKGISGSFDTSMKLKTREFSNLPLTAQLTPSNGNLNISPNNPNSISTVAQDEENSGQLKVNAANSHEFIFLSRALASERSCCCCY